MTDFREKWYDAVQRKGSILCVGLDPAEPHQRNTNTIARGVNKLEWCLKTIYEVAPHAAAIKPNRNYFRDFSRHQTRELVDAIHDSGMVAIDDSKLVDIGATNDAGFYHAQMEGFDAVTYAPFPGNIEEAASQAHARGLGLIPLVLMSNAQFEHVKRVPIEGLPAHLHYAREVKRLGLDAAVIAAPSAHNHLTENELLWTKVHLGDKPLVLMPGVGAQGGDAKAMLDLFGDRVIANVGRTIIYAENPGHQAAQYKDMLNTLRG